AVAALKDREAIPALLAATAKEETRFEATSALAALPDLKALPVYVRALTDRNPDLRRAGAEAIGAISDQAAPVLDQLAARKELPPAAVPELVKVYTAVQPVRDWRVLGPFALDATPDVKPDAIDLDAAYPAKGDKLARWRRTRPVDRKGRVD